MRVFLFGYRELDEGIYFGDLARGMGVEFDYTSDLITMDNCDLAAGYEFIGITPSPVDAPLLDRLKAMGVKAICTRCIGYNHIDVEHAREIGMIVTHITYDPDGVAEFAVMGMLVVLRRVKEAVIRMWHGDFRYAGLESRELRDMSVGIVGAGRIGTAVLRDLTGFGCKLYYADRRRKEAADRYAEYIGFDDLLRRCDIVSLHLALNSDTFHIMDAEAFAKMKEGSIFVNTARGGLVDAAAVLAALKAGKLSAFAFDVVEGESAFVRKKKTFEEINDPVFEELLGMENVVYTPHVAFYTDGAIRSMNEVTLRNLKEFEDTGDCRNEIK